MLDEAAVRRLSRELGVRTDFAEKDYVNSWVLYGIYTTGFGDDLLFKGGTALSKLYFPETWRFSEDLDFTVDGNFTGTESYLREALDAASRPSGIEFTIDEFYEGTDDGYPTYYVEASLQYRAMFDHKNTTELNVMGDEVVASEPVEHTHAYQDLTRSPFVRTRWPRFSVRNFGPSTSGLVAGTTTTSTRSSSVTRRRQPRRGVGLRREASPRAGKILSHPSELP